MKKILLTVTTIVLSLVLVYSGMNIGLILWEYKKGSAEYDEWESQYVTEAVSERESESEADYRLEQPDTDPEDVSQNVSEGNSVEGAPISVNFDDLLAQNSDVQGWIYSEGTPISYPIAHSGDNETYLRHTLSGQYNSAGTLFVEAGNSRGFADLNTVVYGHNLKNSKMFGTLLNYKEQSYYDEHPTLWLLTPGHTYRLEVFAGFTISSTGWPYDPDLSEDGLSIYLTRAYSQSDFATTVQKDSISKILTLSTCSYEYDDARYVVMCSMVEVK